MSVCRNGKQAWIWISCLFRAKKRFTDKSALESVVSCVMHHSHHRSQKKVYGGLIKYYHDKSVSWMGMVWQNVVFACIGFI